MLFEIIRFADAPELAAGWRHTLPVIDAHPRFGAFGRSYYPLVYGERRHDESFAVVRGDDAALLAPCTVGERCLDWYGMPIVLFSKEARTNADLAIRAALGHMENLVEKFQIAHWTIRDNGIGLASAVSSQSAGRRLIPSQRQAAICDLSLDEAEMHKFLRHSARSLVNWGKRSLRMGFLGKESSDLCLLSRYREFHREVAGRVTRADSSWDAMYQWIVGGHGEIVFGYLDDRLVSATMTVDGATEAYYASAVYDRTLFGEKKPLAHWPLWLSMLRAKQRGMILYDLGDIPQQGQATPKEIQIGFFKQGFATQILTHAQWTMDHRASAECAADSAK